MSKLHKEKIKLIAFNNKSWKLMKENISEVGRFLADHNDQSPIIPELIAISIKLVLSEFILNPQYYDKYSIKKYTDEDFIDIVINSIRSQVPEINKSEDNEKYIDEFRSVIWGHIKMIYTKKSSQFMKIIHDVEKGQENLTRKDMDILMDCLTVAWVECILREREHLLLEHSYA